MGKDKKDDIVLKNASVQTVLKLMAENSKEKEKKEADEEAAKVVCPKCHLEISPKRQCLGHDKKGMSGGGGGTSPLSLNTQKDATVTAKNTVGHTLSPTPRDNLEHTDVTISQQDSMSLAVPSIDADKLAFITALVAEKQLLIEIDGASNTLTLTLLCEPSELTPEQQEALETLTKAILGAFDAVDHEHTCHLDLDLGEDGSIRSLKVTMPTGALFHNFIDLLAPYHEVLHQSPTPTPFSLEPKPFG